MTTEAEVEALAKAMYDVAGDAFFWATIPVKEDWRRAARAALEAAEHVRVCSQIDPVPVRLTNAERQTPSMPFKHIGGDPFGGDNDRPPLGKRTAADPHHQFVRQPVGGWPKGHPRHGER